MRHLIDIRDLGRAELDALLERAEDIISAPKEYSDSCRGKTLATLFYEPSTRTRLSFEAAMYELGGNVLGFASADSSSVSKGETIADTVRVVSEYCDVIAMRHPKEGAPLVASRHATVPVINAGDGGHNHPTQTLTDLLTVKREKGKVGSLTVGFCGDLKFGRTVHSLINALSLYEDIKLVLVSPEELRLPGYTYKDVILKNGMESEMTTSLQEVIGELDVLYMTRVQKERFFNEEDYMRLRDSYILTPQLLARAKPDLCVMHPLPRVNEISQEVDSDPRAAYFRQAANGKHVRKALILKLLEEAAR
ncbi:MAG: aspartate carbamoyltransferase [Clostridia bacterium]|nr:aspartate carbamoyltransferase [Clostridia bacterium]MCR5688824.1 aspartate carbamoyltransferase [Clostridiales bacterium]